VSTAFNPADLWQPFSVFSMGVVQGGGRVVHLKGQIALDKRGRIVGKADMRAQTRKTLENIQAVLACVGGTMADILSLTQYVTDIDAFLSTRDVRRRFFTAPYPVTTTVQVVRLYDPELMVEITAVAEVPRDRYRQPAALR
jgi:2-iminobutanoate/2-iminopropanoate deaminase